MTEKNRERERNKRVGERKRERERGRCMTQNCNFFVLNYLAASYIFFRFFCHLSQVASWAMALNDERDLRIASNTQK